MRSRAMEPKAPGTRHKAQRGQWPVSLRPCALCLLAACSFLPSALWLPARSADPASEAVFEVQMAGGATHTGILKDIDADWSVRLKRIRPARLKAGEVI